ncbi:hypothetical protein ACLB2K_025396 [Fragaria x ananassa]
MLYQKAKLVHTDLSEFNVLYFEGHLYIIDVSQAVVVFNSNAKEFLRQDCVHVSVMNVEADVLRLTSGEDTEDMYYKTITGLRHALCSVPPSPSENQTLVVMKKTHQLIHIPYLESRQTNLLVKNLLEKNTRRESKKRRGKLGNTNCQRL